MHKTLFVFFLLVCLFCVASAQEKTGGIFHGLIVGDYFYKAGGDSQQYGDSLSQYSQPIAKDFKKTGKQ